ncbi:ATP-binding protein [Ruminococcaceae bacterium OttesenSCG-928-D13]|nr:ATP-binding protein [Ruminococcaceae bacterium OttesenSCG-928-D13]
MSAVVTVLKIALCLILLITGGVIVHRVILSRRIPVSLCLFLVLPVGQLLMLHSFSFTGWSTYWLLGLLLSVVAGILFLFYAVSQEKKTIAMEELRIIKHRMELEKTHYASVEQRREELEKIRGDFNRKLETVAGLVHSGEDGTARETISTLAERISRTKENVYCNIPIVNAVLTQKAVMCTAAGIELDVDLNMPDTLAVEAIHLCSIFGNILDNAIAACQKLKGAEHLVIHLSSIMDGDYLFIKTTNPSSKPSYTHAPGHGYGQQIVSKLARQYDGSFQSHYRNGVFTAVVSLVVATDS